MEGEATWPRTVHQFDRATALALQAAEATGRPLLLRGDPGNGKSQTARAAAAAAGRPFLWAVIDGRTQAHDLMWRFDAVARLSDAQVRKEGEALVPEGAYLAPGPLWWAYNWTMAQQRVDDAAKLRRREPQAPVTTPAKWNPAKGRAVLLIDEIDKADPDLPNALLEVLANLGFREPHGGAEVHCTEASRPLIVITTNEERELPHAFLRRCVVHHLNLPVERVDLVKYLVGLAERHAVLRTGPACTVLEEAAGYLADERERLAGSGLYRPGTSEYLDLVRAVVAQSSARRSQAELLQEILPYMLKKNAQHST
jgi:MoxR-like ATPase